VIQKFTEFDVEFVAEWPHGFVQGLGLWEQKHEQAPNYSPCDDLTMIQKVSDNPFLVQGQSSVYSGILKTTAVTGAFDLRVRIFGDNMQDVLFTSNSQRIHARLTKSEAPVEGGNPRTP
jgi:hypothetical protein